MDYIQKIVISVYIVIFPETPFILSPFCGISSGKVGHSGDFFIVKYSY